jgi:hypothetical protein
MLRRMEARVLYRHLAHVTKPPIVLWHGLGPPASEGDLMSALPLDDVAAVKVYLGLPLRPKGTISSEAQPSLDVSRSGWTL